ncbi:phospholipase A, partial [Planctomycetota bacterium]
MRVPISIFLLLLCNFIVFGSETEPNTPSDRMKYPRLDAFEEVYQPYIKNLTAYKPTYFLVGTDPSDSKFQFSFKYQFWNDPNSWAQGLHFGYTQTSFWDLQSDSKPFDDTSYKPELFYLTPNLDFGVPWLRGMFIRTGLQHESNGRGG